MTDSIFSRYSQSENHITSTFLAVLKQLSLHNIDLLLGAMLDETIEFIEFKNQPSANYVGVPDAEILSGMRILIETKIVRGTVDRDQLDRHLESLNASPNEYLLILTPDAKSPKSVQQLIDDNNSKNIHKNVSWTSFANLSVHINNLLTNSDSTVSEHECFLLKQFDLLLKNKGLLAPEQDTVIVAAKSAWSIYLATGVYACQPNRSFRDVTYMGFYSNRNIQPKLAKIYSCKDDVELNPAVHEGMLGDAINRLLAERPELLGHRRKVFMLSPPDSDETETLENAIINVKRSKSNKSTAFTMGQRYVSLKSLQGAKNTDDIKKNRKK